MAVHVLFFNISGAPAVGQPLTQPFQHSSPHVSSIQQQHPPQQHHRPGSVDGKKPIREQGRHHQVTGFAANAMPLETGKSIPPQMSIQGMFPLPIGAPPSREQLRLSSSSRRSDFLAPSASSYDRSSILRQQDHNRGAGDVANDSIPRKTGPLQQRTLFDFLPSNTSQ
jgi:hypothetical protein